ERVLVVPVPGEGRPQPPQLSPDGRLLAADVGQACVKVWDVMTGEERAALRVRLPAEGVNYCFSPDGGRLLFQDYTPTSPRTATIRLWNCKARQEDSALEEVRWPLHFAADGKTAAGWEWYQELSEGRVMLWKVAPHSQPPFVLAKSHRTEAP